MRPLIPARFYANSELFDREQRALLSSLWQCVGVLDHVARPNDFLTVELNDKSVVVQNFDGELRALANVCSHRFSRIQSAPRGNRPFRCPYHGWTYNRNGLPTGIPARPRFDDLTPERLCQLSLRSFAIGTAGRFIFVRTAEVGPSLEEYLGSAAEVLRAMSDGLGDLVDENRITIRANWKIVVENTLESYHVNFVHPSTFKRLGASEYNFRFQGDHSSWNSPLSEAMTVQMQAAASLYPDRRYACQGYLHQFIFPNFTVATTLGTFFGLQLIRPVAVDQTEFISWGYEAALPADLEGGRTRQNFLRQAAAEFNRKVFEEDRVICEEVQRGCPHAEGTGALSSEEERVQAFHQAYLRYWNVTSEGLI